MAEYILSDDVFASPLVSEEAGGYEVNNHEMNLAWRLIANTGTSVFLTGKAGTGKTTFLRKLRDLLPKRMVVLAPTGVAAINAQGQTIHSFFQLPFGPITPGTNVERSKNFKMSKDKKNLIRTLDLLVIDEISMVRCDLLDAIDGELRKYKNRYKPFGGVQLLLIGDLQQLPPVAVDREWELLKNHYPSPYFFHSKALQQTPYATVELKHIYRQKDREFIEILGAIRNNEVNDTVLSRLNSRVVLGFHAPEGEDWIRLTTHNRMADDYNRCMMDSLPSREYVFTAQVEGKFPETSYPADEELTLKVGAQVMFIKNDPSGQHAYYNGKIGVVTEITDEGIEVYSKEDDTTVNTLPVEWENTRYVLDAESAEIRETVEGRFRQVPLRPAWAITVHKSQGLTFDHAVLDINNSFAHGQAYVALSRCRSLEGLVLTSPLTRHAVISDSAVRGFVDESAATTEALEESLGRLAKEYFLQLLQECFDFRPFASDLRYVYRILREHVEKQAPRLADRMGAAVAMADRDLVAVSERFATWCRSVVGASENPAIDEMLQAKVKNGCRYYLEKVNEAGTAVAQILGMTLTNKQVVQQLNSAIDTFREVYRLKKTVLSNVGEHGFTVKNYLMAKARGFVDSLPEEDKPKQKRSRGERKTRGAKTLKETENGVKGTLKETESGVKGTLKETENGVKGTQKESDRDTKGTTLEELRVEYGSAYMPWNEEQDAMLLGLLEEGNSNAQIARAMGRTPGAIRRRIIKLLGEEDPDQP